MLILGETASRGASQCPGTVKDSPAVVPFVCKLSNPEPAAPPPTTCFMELFHSELLFLCPQSVVRQQTPQSPQTLHQFKLPNPEPASSASPIRSCKNHSKTSFSCSLCGLTHPGASPCSPVWCELQTPNSWELEQTIFSMVGIAGSAVLTIPE